MNDSLKKLTLFVVVFIVGAIIIFLVIDKDKPATASLPPDYPSLEASDEMTKEPADQEILAQLDQLKQALAENHDNFTLITHIANIYYDLDRPDSAIAYYERALQMSPSDAAVLTDCAVMHYKHGNPDKALEYLDKAITIKPDLGQAWYNKGLILMTAKNEPISAIETWRKYIELDPLSEQAEIIRNQIEDIKTNMGKNE